MKQPRQYVAVFISWGWVRRSKEVARSMLQITAIDHSIEGSDNHFLTAKASLQAKANRC